MTELSDRIAADIRGWDAIEDHRTGTAGDRETSAWLADEVRAAGLEPLVDEFEFARWVLRECAVESEGRSAGGVPLFDGGTTGGGTVEAPLRDLADAGGGIGLGSLGISAPEGANRAFAEAREAGDCQGLVAVAAMDADVPGLALQNADRFTAPFGPPALQVASGEGAWLAEAAAGGATARLTVNVDFETSTASNVQARVAGHDGTLAPLVVMTPKSAWWTCTAERAGGIAIWLALLRHFAAERPARDVVFTANTGHELGHTGLDHYLDRHPSLVRGAHLWIHLGANFAARDSMRRLQTSDPLFEEIAKAALAEQGVEPHSVVEPGVRPGGEARNIYDGGGRYLSWLGSNRWFHHPADRWPDTIDLDVAERLTRAMLKIAPALAQG